MYSAVLPAAPADVDQQLRVDTLTNFKFDPTSLSYIDHKLKLHLTVSYFEDHEQPVCTVRVSAGLIMICVGLVRVCVGLVKVCVGLVKVCVGLVRDCVGLVRVYKGLVRLRGGSSLGERSSCCGKSESSLG